MHSRPTLRRFLRDRGGVAATELALGGSLLAALLLGMSEASLYLAARYRTAQMATTVGDVVARYESVTAGDVEALLSASSAVMEDRSFPDNGLVILSSVAKDKAGDEPVVAWQCKGGGRLVSASRVGNAKTRASLPGGLTLEAGDNVIVAEVFYRYAPTINFAMKKTTTFYDTSVFRPRLGALTTAPGCQ